ARDEHLRSADFFEVEKYPEITFSSTSIEKVDDETVKITGDLTLHGETHPVELDAEIGGVETGPEGETRTGLEVTGTLSRKEWGMHFNAALGSGNAVVSEKVKLTLDTAAVRAEGYDAAARGRDGATETSPWTLQKGGGPAADAVFDAGETIAHGPVHLDVTALPRALSFWRDLL